MPPINSRVGANARSPFAGCVILILALLVIVFLITFSTWGLFRLSNEIARFTDEKARPVPVATLDGHEAEINALAEKLEKFRQDLTGAEETRLELSPAELNLAIAAYEPFQELRQTFHVTAVEGDTLKLAVSLKLNGKPRLARADEPGVVASDPRFLNGTLIARPQLLGNEVALQVVDIQVPGATVPREFIEHMSPYRIADRYQKHPVIGPAMAKLTSVSTGDGRFTLIRKPGETPADRISDSQVDAAGNRFFLALGIGACVFLAFVAVIIFIGLRAKAAKERFNP
jgi:hypothetical protein